MQINPSATTTKAIQAVLQDIASRQEWSEEVSRGKMFGILTARNTNGDTVILKAYSGQIMGRSDWEGYVPAIFDYLQEDGYFKTHEAEISLINKRIKEAEVLLPKGKRSAEVERMKAERKERSNFLQRWLFSQFMLTSHSGQKESVLQVFKEYASTNKLKQSLPPGGTGECCAPKLLQYANDHQLEPLELVEFWYGASPKGEVRHHGQYYEPCQAKCQPILWFLAPKTGLKILGGQPSLQAIPQLSASDIIYEDDWFVAINKPAKLLSVPGKRQMPNAEDQLKELLEYKGQFLKMTHRLDMDTSGVLLAAKTPEAHEAMQRMFAKHEDIEKEYWAVVCPDKKEEHSLVACPDQNTQKGITEHGIISLPLAPDFINRPRQRVDHAEGKEAVTEYFITGRTSDGNIKLKLFPKTGRTHQLRMHCAHSEGLNMPILGDPLYGNTTADKMYLHAARLTFVHPFTNTKTDILSEDKTFINIFQ